MSNAVPEGWEIRTLSDLADIDNKSLKNNTDPDYIFRYIDIASVKTAKVDVPTEYVSFRESPSRARKRVHKGDVLMSTVRPNLKSFAYFDVQGDDFVASTGFAVLTANKMSDSNFLYQSILSDSVTRQIESLVAGSNYPAISSANVKSLEVLAPPLPEQQKIATILSSVDDVIGKTRAQIDKLKDLKTGMMQELLTKGIGHTEFKDSPVGQIPKAWGYERLENVATIQTGIAINSKIIGDLVDIPYLRVANVQDGYLDLTEVKTLQIERNRLERFMLRDEDVLVNEGGDFDKLGRGFIWKNQISPCVHQNHVFVVRTDQKKILPMYFNYLSGSQYGKKYYLGCAKQTTNLASINSSQLKLFPVLLPAVEEQERICKILNSIDLNIGNIEQKLFSIEMTKKALMQDLLTGKVRVKTQKDMLKNVE